MEKSPFSHSEETFLRKRRNFQEEQSRKAAASRHKWNPLRFVFGSKSQEAFMEEEAALDNELFVEFKEWERRAQPVFQHLRDRRDGKEKEGERRMGVAALGGGMLGAYGAGQLMGLDQMGYTSKMMDFAMG